MLPTLSDNYQTKIISASYKLLPFLSPIVLLFNGEPQLELQAEGTNKGVEAPFQARFQCTLQRGGIAHERDQKALPCFEIARPCPRRSEEIERRAVRGSSR